MKKIKMYIVFVLALILSPFLVSCGKTEIAQITVSGYKQEFMVGEDFSINYDNLTVKAKRKDDIEIELTTENFVTVSDTVIENDFVRIDFTAYNKNEAGEYPIIVSYVANTDVNYSYTVRVINQTFTDSDYTVTGYAGTYDGKPHTITLVTLDGATIKYGLSEDDLSLDELPQFTDSGDYTVYFSIQKTGYNGSLTGQAGVKIEKAELTIIPHDQVIEYGQDFTDNGADYIGFVGSDTADLVKDQVVFGSDYTKGSDVGEYTIDVSGSVLTNYNIITRVAKLTVERTDNVLEVEFSDKYTYGDIIQPVITKNNAGTPVKFRYQVKDSFLWNDNLPFSAGEYVIEAQSQQNNNYKQKTITINVVIEKQNLTVKPEDTIINYGEEFVKPNLNYAGFVNNETAENIGVEFEITTNYNNGDNAGEYTITVDVTGECVNYNIVTENGKLTVNRAENPLVISVGNIVYGETFTYQSENNILDSEIVVTYKFVDEEEYTSEMPKNVGTYYVKFFQTGSLNYDDFECEKQIEVTPKQAVIEWSNTQVVYNGTIQSPVAQITNLEENDECTVILPEGKVQSNEEGYVILPVELTNQNYIFADNESVTFVILKVEIDAPSQSEIGSKVYNAKTQKSDINDGDNYIVVRNKGGIEAGNYPVELMLKDRINTKWKDGNSDNIFMQFAITQNTNNTVTQCQISNYYYGQNPDIKAMSLYGQVEISFKKRKEDITKYVTDIPVNAGDYTMRVRVLETDSYNFAMKTCDFTIYKSDPEYPMLNNIHATVGDQIGQTVLPVAENGVFNWSFMVNDPNEYFEEERLYFEYVDFVPDDTENYNVIYDIGAYINVTDSEKNYFNDGDIIVTDFENNYASDYLPMPQVTLTGSAEGATVYYSRSKESGYTTSGQDIAYSEVGNYTIYIKVTKDGYNDYYTTGNVIINDYINLVEVVTSLDNVYGQYAVPRGTELDLSKINFTGTYRSSLEKVVVSGSEFEYVDTDFTTLGKKYVSLTRNGVTYNNVFYVYVYDQVLQRIRFITNETQEWVEYPITTDSGIIIGNRLETVYTYRNAERVDNDTYVLNITSPDELSYIRISQETFDDYDYSFKNITVVPLNDVLPYNGGTINHIVKGILVYDSESYDFTLNLNINYNFDGDFALDGVALNYDKTLNNYSIDTASLTYKNLTTPGNIVGIYPKGTTQFDEKNNLLTNFDLCDIYTEDFGEIIVVFEQNSYKFMINLSVNYVGCVLDKITVNGLDYSIYSAYQNLTIPGNEESVTLGFGYTFNFKIYVNDEVVENYTDTLTLDTKNVIITLKGDNGIVQKIVLQ